MRGFRHTMQISPRNPKGHYIPKRGLVQRVQVPAKFEKVINPKPQGRASLMTEGAQFAVPDGRRQRNGFSATFRSGYDADM